MIYIIIASKRACVTSEPMTDLSISSQTSFGTSNLLPLLKQVQILLNTNNQISRQDDMLSTYYYPNYIN